MSDISWTGGTLEHVGFPNLSDFVWEALHRIAAASGEAIVASLLRSATSEDQRKAIHDFLERERASTPAFPTKNEVIKIETSTYSGVGQDRLPLNRWFREVYIAMDARQLASASARVNFLLSRLSNKANEWALGELVYDASAFPTLEALQQDLRLAFEPPQDESRMRASFFALKPGKLSMSDYVQKARRLVSCVDTSPIDTATQVHIFVFGMGEVVTPYCLVRVEPKTLEEAFAIALLEDYTVASAYTKVLPAEAQANMPEPMEIDALDVSASGLSNCGGRSSRGPEPLICFRCRKPGHRAAVCRAPAPILADAEASQLSTIDQSGLSKNGQDQ